MNTVKHPVNVKSTLNVLYITHNNVSNIILHSKANQRKLHYRRIIFQFKNTTLHKQSIFPLKSQTRKQYVLSYNRSSPSEKQKNENRNSRRTSTSASFINPTTLTSEKTNEQKKKNYPQ